MHTQLEGIRLYFKNDEEFSNLKRLNFEFIPITLEDIFDNNVYPWQYGVERHRYINSSHYSLSSDMVFECEMLTSTLYEQLNKSTIPTLSDFEITKWSPLTVESTAFKDHYRRSSIENNLISYLNYINDYVYFSDELTIDEIFKMSVDTLNSNWNNETIKSILSIKHRTFAELRTLIKNSSGNKKRKKKVILKSNEELHYLNLQELLHLEDFIDEEMSIMQSVFEGKWFKHTNFINNFVDSENRLKLTTTPKYIDVYTEKDGVALNYVSYRKEEKTIMYPNLNYNHKNNQEKTKTQIKEMCKKWGTPNKKYIIEIDNKRFNEMLLDEPCDVYFPGLYTRFKDKKSPNTVSNADPYAYAPSNVFTKSISGTFRSTVNLDLATVCRYRWGWGYNKYTGDGSNLSKCTTNSELQDILKLYKQPYSGTKEVLLTHIAVLAIGEYNKYKNKLKKYFTENPYMFIKFVKGNSSGKYVTNYNDPECMYSKISHIFPKSIYDEKDSVKPSVENIEDSLLKLYKLVVSIYFIMHIRSGSVILDPNYTNELYTEYDVASGLLNLTMCCEGYFVEILKPEQLKCTQNKSEEKETDHGTSGISTT